MKKINKGSEDPTEWTTSHLAGSIKKIKDKNRRNSRKNRGRTYGFWRH